MYTLSCLFSCWIMSLSENLQKCHSLNRVLSYLLLWSPGDMPRMTDAPLTRCVHRGLSPPSRSTPCSWDLTVSTQPTFVEKLSLVSSKRGILGTCLLCRFHNLPPAFGGESLAPVPQGKCCVYWPSLPQNSPPSPAHLQGKKSGCRRITQCDEQICPNGVWKTLHPTTSQCTQHMSQNWLY